MQPLSNTSGSKTLTSPGQLGSGCCFSLPRTGKPTASTSAAGSWCRSSTPPTLMAMGNARPGLTLPGADQDRRAPTTLWRSCGWITNSHTRQLGGAWTVPQGWTSRKYSTTMMVSSSRVMASPPGMPASCSDQKAS